jgi:hypothetical protein
MDFTKQFYKLHLHNIYTLHAYHLPRIGKEFYLEGAGRRWALAMTHGGSGGTCQVGTRGAGRRRGSPDPQTLMSGEHSGRCIHRHDKQIVRCWDTGGGWRRARTRAVVSC